MDYHFLPFEASVTFPVSPFFFSRYDPANPDTRIPLPRLSLPPVAMQGTDGGPRRRKKARAKAKPNAPTAAKDKGKGKCRLVVGKGKGNGNKGKARPRARAKK
jgi:hypothetical protein